MFSAAEVVIWSGVAKTAKQSTEGNPDAVAPSPEVDGSLYDPEECATAFLRRAPVVNVNCVGIYVTAPILPLMGYRNKSSRHRRCKVLG